MVDLFRLGPLLPNRAKESLWMSPLPPDMHKLSANSVRPAAMRCAVDEKGQSRAYPETRVRAEIVERVRPVEEVIERLLTIPGMGRRTARVLVAKIGTDVGRFPSAAHLASWAACARASTRARASGRVGRGGGVALGCGWP